MPALVCGALTCRIVTHHGVYSYCGVVHRRAEGLTGGGREAAAARVVHAGEHARGSLRGLAEPLQPARGLRRHYQRVVLVSRVRIVAAEHLAVIGDE